jgi:hypothetical protein
MQINVSFLPLSGWWTFYEVVNFQQLKRQQSSKKSGSLISHESSGKQVRILNGGQIFVSIITKASNPKSK